MTADDASSQEGHSPRDAAGDGSPPPVSREVLDTVLTPGSLVERHSVAPAERLRPVAGGRHEARERAVHLLYEAEIRSWSASRVIAEQVLPPDPFTEELVRGVHQHREQLDEVVARLAQGWTLERMATLDLVVLRLGVFELAHRPEVPLAVVLAEAVGLAGRYGTDDSSRFVNGVLASAARELRPAEAD